MPRNVAFNEDQAIQYAMEVFWEKGYNGTSLRDLTDAMKINSSSLYNTIGDKQELFVRCIRHYTAIRNADLRRRANSSASPLQTLKQYIDDAVTSITNEPNGCMAVKTAFEVANKDERIKAILKQDGENTYQFLYTLLNKSIKQREIPDTEEPAMLADYLMSMLTGWYESYIVHRDADKIRKMAGYFLHQLSK
ncbi:TetR/AcrR family transcriptional regulator [Chitinophaga horti]|uniref:TetR/AcrR family transcriptional regulator n=1 Tax=Chitinophaga horti TaxID=2920382 RepID=A0ABY6J7I9_9BACT|nr:TetR/AcrR family transcriptional regulator [Chitinophaga horti]UYQ95608.1 TetR/AcrR family transcriptional regulator [Chitinophaga horti]